MLSGTRIHNGEIEKEYSFSIHSLKVNDVLGLQVLNTGDLIYYVNGAPQGIAISGIPVKKDIFAVFDVYGRTKQVSLKYFGGEYWYMLILQKMISSPYSAVSES